MEAEETMECLQEFPEHHKMILDRLNEQREQDRFTDITLIVDGGLGQWSEERIGDFSFLPFTARLPPPPWTPYRSLWRVSSAPGGHLSVSAHMDHAADSWLASPAFNVVWCSSHLNFLQHDEVFSLHT
jgi:hypothetical protein